MQLDIFETREQAFSEVASRAITALKEGIFQKGRATLLLSGGRTPAPAYKLIAESPLKWTAVAVGLVDDRWVAEDDSASNGMLVRQSFMKQGAVGASFVPMKTVHEHSVDAIAEVETAYQIFRTPDVAIIGLGPDGHTASWFPGSADAQLAMSPENASVVASIDATGCPVAGKNTDRMTVTLPVLVRAACVILVITGDEKRKIAESGAADLPIQRLNRARNGHINAIWAP